jgi:hypothetical protein
MSIPRDSRRQLSGEKTGDPKDRGNAVLNPKMLAYQFKPGESGNPSGRPKRLPISDALRELMEQPYSGREKRFRGLSNAQVLAVRMFELAIAGDVAAAKECALRVDGAVTVRQQLSGPEGGPIPWASYTDRFENERRIAELELIASMRSGDGKIDRQA